MKEKIFLCLMLLISSAISAQIKGIVVDENNKPISYVNIWVENENKGTTSEENGTFTIDSTNDKTLIFSALGFETKKAKASEAEKVVMKVAVFQLNEVVVSKPIMTKEIEVGNSKDRFYLPEPQTVPWILAKKIDLDSNNPDAKYVKNIILFTKSEIDGAVFRIRIFNVDQNGLPGEDIISKEIIIKAKKGKHKTVVDMSAYKLEVPKEGIIVGFESLLTEGNKYKEKAIIMKTKKTVLIDNYAPHIMYYYTETETSFTFRVGRWIKQQFSMYDNSKDSNRVIAPAINITLTN